MIFKIPNPFLIKTLKHTLKYKYLPHSDMEKVKHSLYGNNPNSLNLK